MPIAVHVDPVEGIRCSVATGRLRDEDLMDAYSAMLSDPAFDPSLDHLVDLAGVDRFDVTPGAIRALAEIMALADGGLPEGAHRRVAIVAPSPEALAAALLYRTRRVARQPAQGTPLEIRFFQTGERARRWLRETRRRLALV